MTLAMALFALAVVLLATAWWLHFSQPPRPLLLDESEPAPAVSRNSWYRITGAYPRVLTPRVIAQRRAIAQGAIRDQLPTLEWHSGIKMPVEPTPTTSE